MDVGALSNDEVLKQLLELDRARQRLEADLGLLLVEAGRRRLPGGGFRNEKLWLAHETRDAKGRAGRRVERGHVLWTHLPALGDRYRRGLVNDSHVSRFSSLWNRHELREPLLRDLDVLLGWATTNSWPVFARSIDMWEQMVDPIDPNERAARAFRRRRLVWAQSPGHDVLIEIDTTSAHFAQLQAILQPIVDRLFEQDWAAEVAENGEDASIARLERNDAQRWHDALFSVLRAGAANIDPGIDATVNVIVDHRTLIAEAERRDRAAAGSIGSAASEPAVQRAAPTTLAFERRCETLTGVAVSPSDAFDFALAGHVRLFVMNTATGDFTASRRARLFTGPKRLGILIRDRHCQSPGCDTTASRCEVDHIVRYAEHPLTLPATGQALCGPCHRHKTRLESLGLYRPPDDS